MAENKEQEAAYKAGDMSLFEFGHFSDVRVECGSKSWNLHRNILYTRSVWFQKTLCGPMTEATEQVVRIREQNPEAVEICLRYIYGGAAVVDMAEETRFRPYTVFKFCAELYRSADFFLLQPLLPTVQRRIGDHCDEKIKWIMTRGNVTKDEKKKTALVWVEDLKAAILETHKWKTPVINVMLMEFVWAGKSLLTTCYQVHTSIGNWLHENARGWRKEMDEHCDVPLHFRGRRRWGDSIWNPAPCSTPIPDYWRDTCVRCGSKLDRDVGGLTKDAYGQLQDPFNSSGSCTMPREWCRECAAEDNIPWREDGYR